MGTRARKSSVEFHYCFKETIQWVNKEYGKEWGFKIPTPKMHKCSVKVLNDKDWKKLELDKNKYAICYDLIPKINRVGHKNISKCASMVYLRASDTHISYMVHEFIHAVDFFIDGIAKDGIRLSRRAKLELRANAVSDMVVRMNKIFKERGVVVK